jgi:hypothetical protein
MQTLPIYIFDYAVQEKVQKQLDENELMGFKKNPVTEKDLIVPCTITEFYFNERKLSGYWVDPDKNDDSGTINDIIVSIGYQSFRSPYSQELINLLNSLL